MQLACLGDVALRGCDYVHGSSSAQNSVQRQVAFEDEDRAVFSGDAHLARRNTFAILDQLTLFCSGVCLVALDF